jgi:hypothetical protein
MAKTELDQPVFAHTSPVYVDFAGRQVFDMEAARQLVRRVEETHDEMRSRGKFEGDASRDKVLAAYDAANELLKRINQHGK